MSEQELEFIERNKDIIVDYMHRDIYYIRLLKFDYIMGIIYFLQKENNNLSKTINELKSKEVK